MKYGIILLLFISIACKGQKSKADGTEAQAGPLPELTLLMTDNYGGTEAEELLVIRSNKELQVFFTGVNKTRKPGLTPPEIDFTKEMVVVYCSGKNGNSTIEGLKTMTNEDKHITLISSKLEKKDTPAITAVTMPFGLYKMPITEKEIILHSKK